MAELACAAADSGRSKIDLTALCGSGARKLPRRATPRVPAPPPRRCAPLPGVPSRPGFETALPRDLQPRAEPLAPSRRAQRVPPRRRAGRPPVRGGCTAARRSTSSRLRLDSDPVISGGRASLARPSRSPDKHGASPGGPLRRVASPPCFGHRPPRVGVPHGPIGAQRPLGAATTATHPDRGDAARRRTGPPERGRDATKEPAPQPVDEVDEWGYESFPASDPPQH